MNARRMKTFTIIYFAGLFGMIFLFISQTIRTFNTVEIIDVAFLIILGFLTLSMGQWWLPIVAKITGLKRNSGK